MQFLHFTNARKIRQRDKKKWKYTIGVFSHSLDLIGDRSSLKIDSQGELQLMTVGEIFQDRQYSTYQKANKIDTLLLLQALCEPNAKVVPAIIKKPQLLLEFPARTGYLYIESYNDLQKSFFRCYTKESAQWARLPLYDVISQGYNNYKKYAFYNNPHFSNLTIKGDEYKLYRHDGEILRLDRLPTNEHHLQQAGLALPEKQVFLTPHNFRSTTKIIPCEGPSTRQDPATTLFRLSLEPSAARAHQLASYSFDQVLSLLAYNLPQLFSYATSEQKSRWLQQLDRSESSNRAILTANLDTICCWLELIPPDERIAHLNNLLQYQPDCLDTALKEEHALLYLTDLLPSPEETWSLLQRLTQLKPLLLQEVLGQFELAELFQKIPKAYYWDFLEGVYGSRQHALEANILDTNLVITLFDLPDGEAYFLQQIKQYPELLLNILCKHAYTPVKIFNSLSESGQSELTQKAANHLKRLEYSDHSFMVMCITLSKIVFWKWVQEVGPEKIYADIRKSGEYHICNSYPTVKAAYQELSELCEKPQPVHSPGMAKKNVKNCILF
jgi:hypothetical protein